MTGSSKPARSAVKGGDIFLRRYSKAGYRINTRYSGCAVGLEVGGHNERPDLPKLGQSLLISTCLILAIRTAKWAPNHDERLSYHDLDKEIAYSIHLAGTVLSKLLARKDAMFPHKREPWYQPDDEDIPK